MCGICGIVSLAGGATAERAERMCAVLAHRGPDSSGVVADGQFALAARRLAIIDLESGDQPVRNESGSVHVVQNGEILNYAELRESLARDGHSFTSRGDTEVIAHLYERHGDDFATRLRGMFAIAIWDAHRRRLVLARDRFGIKPLYYRVHGTELEFASELRALPRGEIDLDALEAFLAFNVVPGPLTIFRECRKLGPGQLLIWEDGHVRQQQFANAVPAAAKDVRQGSTATLADELRETLSDSVRAHLVADVPVGVLLSGGVDSGIIAALAAEASSQPLHT
ncbi:MAG: asparagine synthase (glutamine-hydrolyzing), partial [Actinomycetota bacterium]|nr:asparagine synthase (glutamine-hydrolyzing) [Actinomycetota bacterium]